MPKMKTRSSAKKRFKKVGNGLVKRAQGFRRHLLTKKSRKKKRQLRKAAYVLGGDRRNVLKLLPN